MHKSLTPLITSLLAGALLAGCVTTKGVEPEAPIVPLVDVAQRKADLAVVPANERVRWCKVSRAQPSLARRATTTGPIEYQEPRGAGLEACNGNGSTRRVGAL